MTTDKPIATRLIPTTGGFKRVPAYVAAPPRLRGNLTEWLAEQRAMERRMAAEDNLDLI